MWKKIASYLDNLKEELIKRGDKDQEIRKKQMRYPSESPDDPIVKEMAQIDEENTKWLKTIVQQIGFPGIKEVGEEAADAAWAIAQHSPDANFRALVLQYMESNPTNYKSELIATMKDRVLTDQGKPQLYGTQYETKDGKNIPDPIQDPDKVDERRKSMGMGTLKEYLEES